MSFRLALVQPMSHQPPDDEKNVADAIQYIEQAAAQGEKYLQRDIKAVVDVRASRSRIQPLSVR